MLECLEWLSEEKQTKPPSRFSEASLVRELEKNGVGRPSTYAQILSTLSTRRYALREKRSLSPTTLGRSVNELLVRDLNALFNVEFTAHMEEELDDIEEGRVEWKQMIRGFYKQFELWMEGTKAPAADRDKVVRLLSSLENVTEWLPPTTRGKRKYDDKKFVLSLQTQLEKGEKPVSERQLEALARIACRYCATYEELDAVIRDCGFEKLLESGEAEPPRETTLLKLKALDALDLDERGRSFVDSLASRVESGRRLSDAQLRALDSMVRGHAGMLENFEALCLEVGIDATPAASDPECEALLDVLSGVKKWNEAVKRGKRVFDDKAFFESVAEQFRRKGSLSDRQKAAMKRLVVRYREQLASFDELAVRFGLSVADKDETKNHN